MGGNFSFLKEKWPELSELGQMAEDNLYKDSNTTMIKLRMMIEQIVDYIFAYDDLEGPEESSLYNKLKILEREELIEDKIEEIFHTLRLEGNKAVHESYESVEEAKTLLSLSHKLAEWFMRVYGEWDFEAEEFELPEKSSEKDIEKLEEKYDELIQELQQDIQEIKNQEKSTEEDKEARAKKSKEFTDSLIFNGKENEIIEITRTDNSTTIDSSKKFITTDVIDSDQDSSKKLVWDAVRRSLSGCDCLAYWKYPLFSKKGEKRKEPDVVIVDKEIGVVVLEILDLSIEDIKDINGDIWELENGDEITPILDVEDQLYALKGLYQDQRSLRRIYERSGIVLPNIEKNEWLNRDFDPENILFSDQLGRKSFLNGISDIELINGDSGLDNKSLKDLLMVLTGQETFSETSEDAIKEEDKDNFIIGTIKDVFTNGDEIKPRNEVKAKVKEALYEVDMQQEVIGKTIPPGPQRIRGIAGSGKTVLLAQKAAHMHLKHPDWKIGLIFFTRSLYDNVILEVDKWLNRFSNGKVGYDSDNENLQILHAWGAKDQPGFYREMCNLHDVKPLHAGRKVLGDGDPNEKLVKACKLLLEKVDDIKQTYDAILIDEAQDLVVDDEKLKYKGKQSFYWLAYKALKAIPGKDSKRLIWAYDEAQSLNALNIPTAPELFGDDPEFKRMVSGFHEGGMRKSEIMNKCYRTPGPVLTAAHAIGMGLLRSDGMLRGFTTQEDWENIGYEVLEGSFNPPGQKVVLHRPEENTPNRVPQFWPDDIINFNKYENRAEEFDQLAESIKYNIEQDNLNPSRDILVIALGSPKEAFQLKVDAAKALNKKGIDIYIPKALKNNVYYPKYPNTDPDKFWNKGGVTVANIFRAKGNEAFMVYVLGLDKIAENEEDFSLRNQLFVALTRTKAWIEVSGIGDYPMYDEFEEVLESGNTFEFTFQRPRAEKIKGKQSDNDEKQEKEIMVNDVVELPSGQRAKVIDKDNGMLKVKESGNNIKEISANDCEYVRKGKQVY